MNLPADWGPLTVLTVVIVVGAVVAGTVGVVSGDLQYDNFIGQLILLAGALGVGTAVGRGLEKGRR